MPYSRVSEPGQRRQPACPPHAAVRERRLKEFPERLLKLGFAAGTHTTSDGDVNGHDQNRKVATADT